MYRSGVGFCCLVRQVAAGGAVFFPLVLLLLEDEATVFPVDFLAVEGVLFDTTFFDVAFFEEVTFFEVLLPVVVAAIPPITQRMAKMAATLKTLTCIERTTAGRAVRASRRY